MNEKIARAGSLIVSITVAIFAVCMLIDFSFGSFFICMILPIGFIMMTSGFYNESESSKSHRSSFLKQTIIPKTIKKK